MGAPVVVRVLLLLSSHEDYLTFITMPPLQPRHAEFRAREGVSGQREPAKRLRGTRTEIFVLD